MARAQKIEEAILETLVRLGPCSLDELERVLRPYSWNQVFAAVDRLSRQGLLILRHPARVGVQVTIRQS
jgi:hypothetical protein